MNTTTSHWTFLTRLGLAGMCVALAACSGPSRPKPTEIQGVPVLQDVRTSWTANVGKVDFPLVVSAREDRIALANSQGGRAFCSKDGTAIFQGYEYIVPAGAASLSFSDQRTSGTIEYDNIDIGPGARYLRNQAVVSSPYSSASYSGGSWSYTTNSWTYTNSGSVARFGLVSQAITSIIQFDATVYQYLADHFANPEYRVESLDFEVTKLDALGGTIWPSFLSAEIGTKVSVARTPVYTTARTYTCLIQGMNHDITPNSWRCNLMLSPAS